MIRLPEGFKPVTLSDMLMHFGTSAPTLGYELMKHLGLPEDHAAEKIVTLEAKGHLQFSIASNGAPAVFIDRKSVFTSEEDAAFANKVVSFFDVTGDFDATSGVISSRLICDFCSEPDPKNTEHVPSFMMPVVNQESVGDWATCDTCHQLIKENRRKDLLNRSVSMLMMHKDDTSTAPALKSLQQKFWDVMDASKRPPLPPSKVPHWQEALDQKFKALSFLKNLAHAPMSDVFWDLKEDRDALLASEVYSFNGETMHAILTGAQSIPHESSLKSIELPAVKAGWFWFGEPLPIASSPITSDRTHALLWAWDTNFKTPTLRFSAYVLDEKGQMKDHILPSTKWFWPLDATYHQMVGLNIKWYREVYSPERKKFMNPDHLIGEEATIKTVSEISLFFMMACLWFKQTVPGHSKLTQESGHIERHARKRYEREHKLDAAPTVKVVALRKSQATAEPHDPSDESKRHYHVRFVVSGHARLQACGPQHKDRKLIWVDAYPKGPEDAPFKEAGQKVYAVVR